MRLRHSTRVALPLLLVALLAVAAGCGRDSSSSSSSGAAGTGDSNLSGTIQADGSSTVGPMTTYAAEQFQAANPNVNVTVGISGTGGGFERFCNGETDISDASRPIKTDPADKEATVCKSKGIDYTRVPGRQRRHLPRREQGERLGEVPDRRPAEAKIWEPDSKVNNWNQVDPSFPDEPLKLFGPGTDSGTFDFFTGEINGEEGASRTDYTASEDDNVTVAGVEGEKGGLGYFGYSYYEENKDKMNIVQVDGGNGCVTPSVETVQDGTYKPLSRPLFIYVKNTSFKRPEVEAFVKYIIDNEEKITGATGLISRDGRAGGRRPSRS